jgi:hypothetical protein
LLINASGKRFLSRINPEERLLAKELLEHPFITNINEADLKVSAEEAAPHKKRFLTNRKGKTERDEKSPKKVKRLFNRRNSTKVKHEITET